MGALKIFLVLIFIALPTATSLANEVLDYVEKNFSQRLKGGPDGGAYVSKLPNGDSVVYVHRSGTKEELERIRKNTIEQARSGDFAKVRAAGYRKDGRLMIVMENMRYDGKEPALAWGHADNLDKLRDLPREERVQIRDRVLKLLQKHPDGHYPNVVWRKVRTDDAKGYRIDVVQIDPYDVPLEKKPSSYQAWARTRPERYQPAWQRKRANELLGLTGTKETVPSSSRATERPKEKVAPLTERDLRAKSDRKAAPITDTPPVKEETPKGSNFKSQRAARGRGEPVADGSTGRGLASNAATVGGFAVVSAAAAAAAWRIVDYDNRQREAIRQSLNEDDFANRYREWREKLDPRFGFEPLGSGSNDFWARERNIDAVRRIAEGEQDKKGGKGPSPSEVLATIITPKAFLEKLKAYQDFTRSELKGSGEEKDKIVDKMQKELAAYAGKYLRKKFIAETDYREPWRRIDYKKGTGGLPGSFWYNVDTDRFYGSPLPAKAGMADLKKYLGPDSKIRLHGGDDTYEWLELDDFRIRAKPRAVAEEKVRPHAQSQSPSRDVHR